MYRKIKNIAVYLSGACNLKCSYCSFRDNAKDLMTFEEFRGAVEILKRKKLKKLKFTFLGGEPLLHFSLLKRCVLLLKKEMPDCSIVVFTNGTLLKKEKKDFLFRQKIKIVLSLDGLASSTDLNRRFAGDKKSVHNEVFKNILKNHRNKVAVNMAVSCSNVKSLSSGLRFLYGSGFKTIGWNVDYSCFWKSKDIAVLKKEMLLIKKDYLQMLKNGAAYEMGNSYEIIEETISKKKSLCETVSLFPKGAFFACDKIFPKKEESLFLGKNLNEGKRKAFFEEAKLFGAFDSALNCRVGVYAYYKFVKCFKGERLKKSLKRIFNFLDFVQKERKEFILTMIRYSLFRKIHGL